MNKESLERRQDYGKFLDMIEDVANLKGKFEPGGMIEKSFKNIEELIWSIKNDIKQRDEVFDKKLTAHDLKDSEYEIKNAITRDQVSGLMTLKRYLPYVCLALLIGMVGGNKSFDLILTWLGR